MTHTIASLQDKTPKELSDMLAELLNWTWQMVPSNEEMRDAREGRGAYEGMPGYPVGGGPLGGMQSKWWKNPEGKWANHPLYAASYDAIMGEVKKLEGSERMAFAVHFQHVVLGHTYSATLFEITRLIAASPADLTRALILTKQTNEETK